jgi:peptidoglycan/xylan/chitin deacetylase (PgdA/CDA1 family)
MYHYVRDLPRTRFPRIKGMLLDNFRTQVRELVQRYEVATLESALAFLGGQYKPRRDLCLLTFDDGLKEHYSEVTSILHEHGIQGLFFIITSCLEEQRVVSVHKNHFLMASMSFEEYRRAFLDRLSELSPETDTEVAAQQASFAYRWDSPKVAKFKYLLNFRVSGIVRDQILDELFAEYLGDEREFARQLYISWEEARQMQRSGMLMGGHSHRHVALAKLDERSQHADLEKCTAFLHDRLHEQPVWPFSYPYGKPTDSFNVATERCVQELGFACAFSSEVGENRIGQESTRIRRIDPKDVCL